MGSILPVAELAALARQRGILLHSDAAQSLGKVEVDVTRLGVDALTIVGHKFGAPKGELRGDVVSGGCLPTGHYV